MADRNVTVQVNVSATGNAGAMTQQVAAVKSATTAVVTSHQDLAKVSRTLTYAFGGMLGAVAAAGGGAFDTFTGSVKMAAAELGIALIPTITALSGWFQDLARTIRSVNEATGGWAGKIVGGAIVMGVLAAAAIKASMALNFLAARAGFSAAAAAGGTVAGGGLLAAGATALPVAGTVAIFEMVSRAIRSNTSQGQSFAMGFGTSSPLASMITMAAGIREMIFGGGASTATAFSTGFQGQSMGLGDAGAIAQHEAIRESLEQERFDQQMRAMDAHIAALNANTAAIGGVPWGVNQ